MIDETQTFEEVPSTPDGHQAASIEQAPTEPDGGPATSDAVRTRRSADAWIERGNERLVRALVDHPERLTLIGVALFGYGWLLIALTLQPLGVMPEEIGIGFTWLVVRVGVMMAVYALLALVLIAAAKRLLESTFKFRNTRASTWAAVLSAVLATLTMLAILFVDSLRPILLVASPIIWIVTAPAADALWYSTDRYVSSGDDTLDGYEAYVLGAHSDTFDRMTKLAVMVLLVVLLVGPAYARNAIERGDSSAIPAGMYSLDRVRIVPTSQAGISGCALYLGSNDGIAVLFDFHDDAIVRLSIENVTLVRGC